AQAALAERAFGDSWFWPRQSAPLRSRISARNPEGRLSRSALFEGFDALQKGAAALWIDHVHECRQALEFRERLVALRGAAALAIEDRGFELADHVARYAHCACALCVRLIDDQARHALARAAAHHGRLLGIGRKALAF